MTRGTRLDELSPAARTGRINLRQRRRLAHESSAPARAWTHGGRSRSPLRGSSRSRWRVRNALRGNRQSIAG